MDNSRLFDNKTALVTVGTSGIGFYMATALARMGAAAYITGRDARRGEEAERQMHPLLATTKNWQLHWFAKHRRQSAMNLHYIESKSKIKPCFAWRKDHGSSTKQ